MLVTWLLGAPSGWRSGETAQAPQSLAWWGRSWLFTHLFPQSSRMSQGLSTQAKYVSHRKALGQNPQCLHPQGAKVEMGTRAGHHPMPSALSLRAQGSSTS